MDIDIKDLGAVVSRAVPFVRTLGLELEAGTDVQRVRLPDDPALTNHVGTAHAGALFTAAETASGLAVLGRIAAEEVAVTPIVVDAAIRYRKPASGVITATPALTFEGDDLGAALASNGRAEVRTFVDLANEAGETVATAEVTWLLRRSGGAS